MPGWTLASRKPAGRPNGASSRDRVAVPPVVGEVLRSPGQPLDVDTRWSMGAAFGFDFGRVRVHADERASESARAVGALAYTFGADIVFGSGRYPPWRHGNPATGRLLLAHELAHVVQQRGRPDEVGRPTLEPASDGHERDADAAAARVVSGRAAAVAPLAGAAGVQRQVHGEVKVVEAELEQVPRILAGVEYQAGEGETLDGIAKRFKTTAGALQRANELADRAISPGQRLLVPVVDGCTLAVPSSPDAQLLAGVIFAEANPKIEANHEREGIGWAFVNSVRHVAAICGGAICPGMTETRRKDQCEIDRQSLGGTLAESIQRGSLAYKGSRWKLVMSGDGMLPAGNLCLLPQSEITALTRAVAAADAVVSGTAAPVDYLRFNQAANSPPNRKRMERSARHGDHTFYRFKPGSECG